MTRERCWKYDLAREFDIRGLFDNIEHALLLRAVRKHGKGELALLSIERWRPAPIQLADGTRVERTWGTPHGGVVSPVLANLFLHDGFDVWMTIEPPDLPWCRYADDGLVHYRTEAEAVAIKAALAARFAEADWKCIRIRPRSFTAKTGSAGAAIRIRSSTSSVMASGRGL